MEIGFFDNRRVNKRLKVLEKLREEIEDDFETRYENIEEMIFLKRNVRWEGAAEIIFLMAVRDVNLRWKGVMDYGFLKLCKKWIVENKMYSMTPKLVAEMTRTILPEDMCKELGEEYESQFNNR